MKFIIVTTLLILCIFSVPKQLNGAKILAIFLIPNFSHQIPFRPLFRALHKRGHELTVITAHPMKDAPATNFRQISTEDLIKITGAINFAQKRMKKESWTDFLLNNAVHLSSYLMEGTLNNTEVRQLLSPASKETFDVVMYEMFYGAGMSGLGHRFNAPLIGISSLGLPTIETYMLGGIPFPSHQSSWEMESKTGTDLSFWKRLSNFWTMWRLLHYLYHHYVPIHQMLAEKYIEKSMPPIVDLVKNVSLVFVNEDLVMSYARPQLSNIINFHLVHTSENTTGLSQGLKKFLDGATNGFIYFSMGGTIPFVSLPEEMQRVFYDVFTNLPCRIVWKNERPLPNLPDNIYMAQWLPQQNILAHPNIKLYVYQGGLQSSQEAIHNAVPLLILPVTADQEFQANRIQSYGISNHLALETLTREKLASSITEMLGNEKYKENAIKLQRIVEDVPQDPIEKLVWWTEYVIRHKGAPHFRTNLASLTWYQFQDLDVIAFLIIVGFIISSITLGISIKLSLLIYKQWKINLADQKKKIS